MKESLLMRKFRNDRFMSSVQDIRTLGGAVVLPELRVECRREDPHSLTSGL